jgi:hypothetical protein
MAKAKLRQTAVLERQVEFMLIALLMTFSSRANNGVGGKTSLFLRERKGTV